MSDFIKKIKEMSTWKKVVLAVAIGGVVLTSNYFITKNIAYKKEQKLINEKFEVFKTLIENDKTESGIYQSLIVSDDKEYLNDSKLYKNSVVTGELSINNKNDKNFSIVDLYEDTDKTLIKGYKLGEDKYVTSTNDNINTLSYKFYKNLPNLIINEMSPKDLNKTTEGAYLIKLNDKQFILDILKSYGIENVKECSIEYLVSVTNESIDKQAFKIFYSLNEPEPSLKIADNEEVTETEETQKTENTNKTLEYTAKLSNLNSIQEEGNTNIQSQEGNSNDIINQFTRKIEN